MTEQGPQTIQRSRLRRRHLLELEDQPWLPAILRDYATDWLRAIAQASGSHRLVAPLVAEVLEQTGERRLVDLCSGGGGPVRGLVDELRGRGFAVEATLTDLYPNREALRTEHPPCIRAASYPVDARCVPAELRGVRTLFNAAHHFRPGELQAILADAAAATQPLVIVEVAHRSVSALLSMALVPLLVWAMTPAIRPFRWSRLFLTYPLPVVPAICLWDGVVSQLRAYRPDELLALAREAAPEHVWRSGSLRAGPAPITYLVGHPP